MSDSDLISHLRQLYASSGETPPTPDQWREIRAKLDQYILWMNTGTLQGIGDMTQTTVATVPVSC